MAFSKFQKQACLILIMALMATIGPHQTEAAISCNTVYNSLYPCLSYVIGGGSTVPAACCSGIQSVYNAAATKEDRQAICVCLKNLASRATPPEIANAAAIPGKCGVNLPYKISPDIDCSKVN